MDGGRDLVVRAGQQPGRALPEKRAGKDPAVGGAPRPLGRAPGACAEGQRLVAGDEEPVARPPGQLLGAVGEADDRRGPVRDAPEDGHHRRRQLGQRRGRGRRRPGEDHAVGSNRRPVGEPDREAARSPAEIGDADAEADPDVRVRGEPAGQRVDQRAHPAPEAEEGRALRCRVPGRRGARPRAALGQAGQEEAPVLPFGRAQLRDHRVEAQLVHGCAVDAPDQRITQARDERGAQPAPKESADRDVLRRGRPREQEVTGHRQLLERREEPGQSGTAPSSSAARARSRRGAARSGRRSGCGPSVDRSCR